MPGIIGCDECNLSPSLAGECAVCALYYFAREQVPGVKDSKLLTRKKMQELLPLITKNSVHIVDFATIADIGENGIYLARNSAILRAVKNLLVIGGVRESISEVVIDGYWSTKWLDLFEGEFGLPVRGVIDADKDIYEVSCASIVAKVAIDAKFDEWHEKYPQYGLNSNHGSLSAEHREALRKYGPCPAHRIKNYGRNWWRNIFKGTKFEEEFCGPDDN